jgi:butyrate kinase
VEHHAFRVLAINPGGTYTRIAVYVDDRPIFKQTLHHPLEQLTAIPSLVDQEEFRKTALLESLDQEGLNLSHLDAVVGRGGLLKPIEGGTYPVNQELLEDLKAGLAGIHPSNLGGILAYEIGNQLNIPSYIVDPVVVDELQPLSRISGSPLIERKSIFHALNHKAVGRRVARDLGRPYESLNLIVTHIGGGITIGVHRHGRVIDVNNGLHGEGPFSSERTGSLPVGDLINLCYSGKFTREEMMVKVIGQGGLIGYLGTKDPERIERRIHNGDQTAALIYDAMGYQIAKEIGAASTVVNGKVDGIVITGDHYYGDAFIQSIVNRVSWISDVFIISGEDELQALVEGTLRVLKGEEEEKIYPNPPK